MIVILYAIPIFAATIVLEAVLVWYHRSNKTIDAAGRPRPIYDLSDAVASLHIGILSRVATAFPRLLTLGLYLIAYEQFSVGTWDMKNPLAWISAVIVYDFFYYWKHRANHEVRIMWAGHITHHNSEFYNLTTALRQSSTTFLFDWIFYLPMAVMGVPPAMFVGVALIDLLYQYWVHTELIGRMGWLDWILVTPSNHRVHHGQDDYCLDKNYGGILILWDRLFGTFEVERDEPITFGVRTPVASVNPLWGNWHYYAIIANDFRQARGVSGKLEALLAPPGGWEGKGFETFDPKQFDRYDLKLPRHTSLYVSIQVLLNLLTLCLFLAWFSSWERWQAALAALWIIAGLVGPAGLMEKRRWGLAVEIVRWLSAPILGWLLFF